MARGGTMTSVAGDVADGYGAVVADVFRRNFADGKEIGAALAVYCGGEKVVDLWGGSRDRGRTMPWERDTFVTVFSTTKGMTATAMAVAHSRGLFDLDAPVASYWPEFAQRGKETITVRQLLAHEAGLAVIDTPIDLAMLGDPDALGRVLAAQAPKWVPGTMHGYHGQSIGWYESQVLRRVDPKARTVGRYFADEVAAPLGLEFHVGLPDDIPADRIAWMHMFNPAAGLFHLREIPPRLMLSIMNPRTMTGKVFMNPKVLRTGDSVNQRDVLRIELPSVNGTGDVRSIAKTYGVLASGGSALGIGAETMAELAAPVAASKDRILKVDTAYSFGFMKPFPLLPFGSSDRAFGHTGMGGSFGFADPDLELGYTYAMTRMGFAIPTDPREIACRRAVYDAIGSPFRTP